MKLIIYFSAIFSVILFTYKGQAQAQGSAQGLLPFYGGGQLSYSDNRDDDDIGLLLTVLLLANRNRGNGGCGGCCGCCNCGGNNIPIPYPIPIPTNNPIINLSRSNDDEGSCAADGKDEINIITENTSNVTAESKASEQIDNNNDNEAIAEAEAEEESER